MLTNKRGFSLVEVLVVMVILGVVTTVIFDLYTNVQRSTVSSEEVVEVQQGLRIALEQVASDIQMAGFLVHTNPIIEAKNNQLTIETASVFNAFARIPDAEMFLTADSSHLFTVSNAAMSNLFRETNYVRIVNPVDGCQPSAADCGDDDGTAPLFQITNVGTGSPPTLTLTRANGTAADITVPAGSMIVRVPSPTDDPLLTYPNVVTYMLEDDLDNADPVMQVLSRVWAAALSTNEKIVATNISGLRFEYLLIDALGNSTVEPSPSAALGTALTAVQRANIVAVRIFLTGLTAEAKTGVSKTRELQTTVKIRNI